MKRSLFLVMAVLVSIVGSGFGERQPIELKNKSSFALGGDRDPFWPIGWKPSGSGSLHDHTASEIPPSAFVVSSITIEKTARFAILNGKIIQEGQQFGLQMGTSTYQLTVKSIQDGEVILARHDEEIVVPLRRK